MATKDVPVSREWNWHPRLPIEGAPFFVWPLRPLQAVKWLFFAYFPLSDRLLYVLFSLIVAYWLQPVTGAQAVFSADWMSIVVLRNLMALLVVAGGLHYWFYVLRGQGDQDKYDPRAMLEDNQRLFKFGHQTWDNMFYSLVSGVPVASAYEIAARWMYANGSFNTINFDANPVWFIALFPLLNIWQSCHFYFVHRALHWKFIYQKIHALHHRSVNPGPWSGMSMHLVEHVLYFSTLFLFLIIASHPTHLLFLLYWQFLGAPSGHAGYEAVRVKGVKVLAVGGFFHQLHHRHFECNYGGIEMPCDAWAKTHHDGSEDATRATRTRMREQRKARN